MLFAGKVGQAGAGLLSANAARAAVLAGLALLAGCAHLTMQGAPTGDPLAEYDAARIGEGMYLASGHVDRATLLRLSELDRAARQAVDSWRTHPDPESAQAASVRVAELSDYLATETKF